MMPKAEEEKKKAEKRRKMVQGDYPSA